MTRRPALIVAGVAAAVILGCYGPGKGVNPNHPPRPQPGPAHSTTPPPPGIRVAYTQER